MSRNSSPLTTLFGSAFKRPVEGEFSLLSPSPIAALSTYSFCSQLTHYMVWGELIVVPLHSTFGDLMAEVENAMRDTYCVTEKLVGTEMEGLEGVEDGE